MRTLGKDLFRGFIMGFLIPGIMLNFAAAMLLSPSSEEPQNAALTQTEKMETKEFKRAEIEETENTISQTAENLMYIPVLVEENRIEEMELDEYLVGVLLGEMPAYFEMEAMKAQSVVARTYTLKSASCGKHSGAAVCTQSACCQAYVELEEYAGTEEDMKKIRQAVEATSGLVLMYDGELIEATYFSCSGGRTEDAAAVWGTDFPYLRSVESPGEEGATHYTDTINLSRREFLSALGIPDPGGPLLGIATYTAGGGIAQMTIGGNTFSGTQLRELLGLRSTVISMTESGDSVTITTMGFGHRVGMSQYGADAMAASGSSYAEILAHYYLGTELTSYATEREII